MIRMVLNFDKMNVSRTIVKIKRFSPENTKANRKESGYGEMKYFTQYDIFFNFDALNTVSERR